MLDAHQVELIRELTPTHDELTHRADLLKAIAHSGRLAVLAALSVRECCVCDLSVILELPVSTVSQHVRRLRLEGLTRSRRMGRFVLYAATQLALDLISAPGVTWEVS